MPVRSVTYCNTLVCPSRFLSGQELIVIPLSVGPSRCLSGRVHIVIPLSVCPSRYLCDQVPIVSPLSCGPSKCLSCPVHIVICHLYASCLGQHCRSRSACTFETSDQDHNGFFFLIRCNPMNLKASSVDPDQMPRCWRIWIYTVHTCHKSIYMEWIVGLVMVS
jgi:hypothetical protein